MRHSCVTVLLMIDHDTKPFMNRDEVVEATDLSRATIDRREKEGLFPQRVQLSPRRVAWRSDEVRDWVASRQRCALSKSLPDTSVCHRDERSD